MDKLKELVDGWKDTSDSHKNIKESFDYMVNRNPALKDYRDFIEHNIWGFGERCFIWMWKLLLEAMPPEFKFLEIGVFKGQILGLVGMLRPDSKRYGITPLTNVGDDWVSDYRRDIEVLHEHFDINKNYTIFEGYSTDPSIITVAGFNEYDIVYIDGGHSYDVALSDIDHYAPLVREGGYLVIDDCAQKYDMPFGYFTGIEEVSKAVDATLPNDNFKELFNVVHNRVFQRVWKTQ